MMWESAHRLSDVDLALLGDGRLSDGFPLPQFNSLLIACFKGDIDARPSVKQIETHAATNLIRSKLEEDKISTWCILRSDFRTI